jgi:hypothetical protein
MEHYKEMKELLASIEDDMEKFYKNGNKSAGTRIRKAMQDIKNKAQELRVHVQETKNDL